MLILHWTTLVRRVIPGCVMMGSSMSGVSHDRQQETPEAKARWFQSLPLEERMNYLCMLTDLILENNPRLPHLKNAQPVAGRIRVVSSPRV